jgi:hypothetical protein
MDYYIPYNSAKILVSRMVAMLAHEFAHTKYIDHSGGYTTATAQILLILMESSLFKETVNSICSALRGAIGDTESAKDEDRTELAIWEDLYECSRAAMNTIWRAKDTLGSKFKLVFFIRAFQGREMG